MYGLLKFTSAILLYVAYLLARFVYVPIMCVLVPPSFSESKGAAYFNPQEFPTLAQFAQNMVGELGKVEVLRQPLYDTILYPTAGILSVLMFQVPQGVGQSLESGAAAGTPKTINDTNMSVQGSLPAPQAYWLDGVEIAADPGSVATANLFVQQIPHAFAAANAAAVQAGDNDINAILSTGGAHLTILQKAYYDDAPLYRFPGRARLGYDGISVATTSATAGEVIAGKLNALGAPMRIDPGLGIMTSGNFALQLLWGALVPTSSGFNARLKAYLTGWLFRAAQ